MLCTTCSKLAILYTNKKCIKCQSDVYQNISTLCETCSSREKICSACLRKIYKGLENPKYKHSHAGCKGCGG